MKAEISETVKLYREREEAANKLAGNKSAPALGLSAEHTPSHIIVFEDTDQQLEPFWDEDVAQARLNALGDNWSCHLYELVESR